MALGELTKCWVCWEIENYNHRIEKNNTGDLKQYCTPIKGREKTIVEGMLIWLCNKCKMNFKAERK